MKITRVTVTDEHGTEHTWEGVTGFVRVASANAKGKAYQRVVDAHLVLPAEPGVKE